MSYDDLLAYHLWQYTFIYSIPYFNHFIWNFVSLVLTKIKLSRNLLDKRFICYNCKDSDNCKWLDPYQMTNEHSHLWYQRCLSYIYSILLFQWYVSQITYFSHATLHATHHYHEDAIYYIIRIKMMFKNMFFPPTELNNFVVCKPKIKKMLALIVFEKIFFNKSKYLRLKEGVALHLNKFESPSPSDTLCQVWLKSAKWFWRRWICEKFTTTLPDNGQILIRKAQLSFQPRLAKKLCPLFKQFKILFP